MLNRTVLPMEMIRPSALILLLFCFVSTAESASLTVQIRDTGGTGLTDAVVYAIPQGKLPPLRTTRAVMDQRSRMFVPHVLPVQTGTAVVFPNSDNVRHQVYSFSPARKFQLPLYAGTPPKPIVFDKPGVIALGCNIHDRMNAWIIVVDTPWFAATVDGRAALTDLPEGAYDVRVWSSHGEAQSQTVRLPAVDSREQMSFVIGEK